MKVLFIHNRLMEYRESIFFGLSDRFDVEYIFTDSPRTTKLDNVMFVHRVGLPGLSYELVPGLFSVIRSASPDLIVTTDATYYISHVVYKYCRRYAVPYVLWTEQWSPSLHPRRVLMRSLERRLFADAASVLALGSAAAEYARANGYKGSRLVPALNTCPPLGKPTQTVPGKTGVDRSVNVLYLSRLVRYKGVRTLAKAAALALELGMAFQFTIAGTGPEERWLNRFARRGNLSNTTFLFRHVGSEEKTLLMNEADIVVLPSIRWGKTEAWGLVLNEALSLGKYVITSDLTGGGKDLISTEDDGVVFRSNSVESLMAALKQATQVVRLNNNEGARRQRYLSRFSEQQLIDGLITACVLALK